MTTDTYSYDAEQDRLNVWFRHQSYVDAYGSDNAWPPGYLPNPYITTEKKEMNEDYTKKIKNLKIDYDCEEDFNVIRNLFDKLDIPYNKSDKYKYCTSMYYTHFYNQFGTTGVSPREKELTYLPQLVRILFGEDTKVKMTIGDKEFYISKESADSIKEGLK